MKIPYMNKMMLKSVNEDASSRGVASLVPKKVELLPEGTLFPIVFTMIHNDRDIRCVIALEEDKTGTVDLTVDRFNLLPTFDTETQESYIPPMSEHTDKRRKRRI